MSSFQRYPIVSIAVDGDGFQDRGAGIVISRRPFRILVPTHVIDSLLDQEERTITLNGIRISGIKVVASSALTADHLSILKLPQTARRSIESIALPRKSIPLRAGQSVHILRSTGLDEAHGEILDVQDQGEGTSVMTNIPVKPGDSGSPMLINGCLAGVCQGMAQQEGIGVAVAVPLSDDGLKELRRFRRQWRLGFAGSVGALLLALLLSFGAFAIYSSSSFRIESIDVEEDGSRITVHNAQRLTLHRSWTRSFETSIRRSHVFATSDQ